MALPFRSLFAVRVRGQACAWRQNAVVALLLPVVLAPYLFMIGLTLDSAIMSTVAAWRQMANGGRSPQSCRGLTEIRAKIGHKAGNTPQPCS